MTSLDVRVPGKLMLLGEYAVLEPGAQALVLAVDRFVRIHIEECANFTLDCPDIGVDSLTGRPTPDGLAWSRDGQPADTTKLRFVDCTLRLAMALARAMGHEPSPCRMHVASELGTGHTKAGLGSSASVAVAVAAGALAWCGFDVADAAGRTRLFQVAALAHFLAQGRRGSGADVAAAVTGGIVAYSNPGFEALLDGAAGEAASPAATFAILERPWNRLRLAGFPWPEGSAFVAASTGEAASTTRLIDRVVGLTGHGAERFRELELTLGELARRTIAEGSAAALGAAMRAHQQALERFDADCGGLGIVTLATQRLVAIAAKLDLPAKISGAGGGDSVVAMVPRQRVATLTQAYRDAGAETFVVADPVAGATVVSA